MANLVIQNNNDQQLYFATYKSYAALITQSGTDAPTAVPLNANDSNYLGDIVWSYNDIGIYNGTLADSFPQGKTATIFGANGSQCYLSGGRSTDSIILIQTNNPDNSRGDDNLYELFLEIRVYQ